MATARASGVHGMDATYYRVKDLARATQFYTGLLGMEPTWAYPNFASEYTFSGGETFGIAQIGGPATHEYEDYWNPGSGIMFAVDDVSAAVAACKSLGGKVHADGKILDSPICQMVFGQDTEGNSFVLHRRKQA